MKQVSEMEEKQFTSSIQITMLQKEVALASLTTTHLPS
jgi:hypothetical protein